MQPERRNFLNIVDIQQSSLKYSIWKEVNNSSQIFFSDRANKFIINDYNFIYLVEKNEPIKLDLQIKNTIEMLAYNDQLNIIAYMNIQGNIYFYWIKYNITTVLKYNKDTKSKVIYFDWLYKNKGFDLMVVQNLGIKLYKIQDQKRNLKEIKSISLKLSSCWFEPKNQILACYNFTEAGIVNIYHFNSDKKSKNNFKGVPLNLDLDESNSNKQGEGALDFIMRKTRSNSKQTKLKIQSTVTNKPLFYKYQIQQYYIQLVNIYEKTTLLFFDITEGKLKIFNISEQQIIKVNLNIKLPSDSHALFNVYDNLLFVHLKYDKISFIYDIKSSSSQPVVSPLPLIWSYKEQKNAYESAFVKKLIIHPSRQIKKWELELQDVFTYNKFENQIFHFLMRRRNGKMILLKWLRENIYKFKVTMLSSFWKSMFDEYEIGLKSENKEKISRMISPTDVYANVFYTLYEDENVDKEKLADIILQCIRQIIEFKLQIPTKLQSLLLKLLIRSKKFLNISLLIHSKIIQDTRQTAAKIIQEAEKLTNKQFEIFQQIITDLYYRRELYKQLIEVFLKFNLVTQAIRVLRKYGGKIQLQDLIKAMGIMTDQDKKKKFKNYLKQYIRQFRPTVDEQFIFSQIEKEAIISN